MNGKLFTNVIANVILVAVVVVIGGAVFSGGASGVFSENKNSPIYRGNGENQVSLIINVYGGNEYLSEILSILTKYQAKCTFFVGGCWVAKNPELLQEIINGGHEVGNHGYFHKEHSKLTYQQNVDEISACSKMIFQHCQITPTLFMPPSGDFGDATLKASKDLSLTTVMWSRDTIDWRDKDSSVIFERATKNTANGELILMHPTLHTAKIFEKILQFYIEKNVELVTVSQNIGNGLPKS